MTPYLDKDCGRKRYDIPVSVTTKTDGDREIIEVPANTSDEVFNKMKEELEGTTGWHKIMPGNGTVDGNRNYGKAPLDDKIIHIEKAGSDSKT